MADFKKAIKEVFKLEFNSDSNILHTNKGEVGYTFAGIYQKANPKWNGWKIVNDVLKKNKNDIVKSSKECFKHAELMDLAEDLYQELYWDKYRLGELNQTVAEEMLVFGVNAGMPIAIKKAQKLAGVAADGVIGAKTIAAINALSEKTFDLKFDEEEKEYYEAIIAKNPSFSQFKKGWFNRAEYV